MTDDRWADLRSDDGLLRRLRVTQAAHPRGGPTHRALADAATTLAALLAERDALAAERPPTAGEVLAHLDAGGTVEGMIAVRGQWLLELTGELDELDPSTPQPGLHLVRQEITDAG